MDFMQRRHQQAWLEGKAPETGTVAFPPSLENSPAAGIDDGNICLGECDGTATAKISKWPQAYQGVGEGGHHMALHGCRGKRWDQSKCHTSNRRLR